MEKGEGQDRGGKKGRWTGGRQRNLFSWIRDWKTIEPITINISHTIHCLRTFALVLITLEDRKQKKKKKKKKMMKGQNDVLEGKEEQETLGEGKGRKKREKGFYMTKTSVSSSVKSSLMVVERLLRDMRRNWV